MAARAASRRVISALAFLQGAKAVAKDAERSPRAFFTASPSCA